MSCGPYEMSKGLRVFPGHHQGADIPRLPESKEMSGASAPAGAQIAVLGRGLSQLGAHAIQQNDCLGKCFSPMPCGCCDIGWM